MTTSLLSVIIDGVETPLGDLGAIVGHLGWGMPKVDSYALRAPGQHGESYGGFALSPRLGSLVFTMREVDLDPMYTLRDELVTLFNPTAPIILHFLTPQGDRYFDCRYYDGLDLNWAVRDWAAQEFRVVLKASDPTCYDPLAGTLSFWLGSSAGWAIPTAIPTSHAGVGVGTIHAATNYLGNWLSYPWIRITGPVTDAKIIQDETGDTLDFTGTTITAGHYYDIDCRYGMKSVVDDTGTNQIDKLTTDSDLASFHLVARNSIEAAHLNSFTVSGSALTGASRVDMTFFHRFLGV